MKKRIEKYIQYHKDGILYKMFCRKVVNITRPFWVIIMRLFPIDNRKVCFDNFEGRGFGGDSKYIFEELLNRNENIKFVWFVHKKSQDAPKEIKQVYIDSISAIYHQSTAKIWVDNTRTGHRTKKRESQKYLQTWHGNLLGKKVERDVEDKLWPDYIPLAKYDGSITDAFIVANQQSLKLAQNSFWLNENVEYLKIGAPSCDVLFTKKNDESLKGKVCKKLGIEESTYIILYAPSFRDNGSLEGYKLDFPRLIQAFETMTKKKCIMLVRFHPDVVQHENDFEYNSKLINATKYDDIKELALTADSLITDYSSVAYDFLVLKKPIFRICLDFDDYKRIRDVYDEFYQLPYGICYSNEEAVKAIESFDHENYQKKIEKYFDINQIYDNGTASKQAADWICEQMRLQ